MDKKTRRKWAAAIPFIVLIIYVLLAYCLDNFTDYEHPYTISLLVSSLTCGILYGLFLSLFQFTIYSLVIKRLAN